MTRKALALLIVVIATGLSPATAIIGFCAKMPCCFEEEAAGPALDVDVADCCSTISCYEAPSNELTTKSTVKVSLVTTPIVAVLSAAPIAPAYPVRTFDDTSPPKTVSERLSTLSTLLI